MRRQVEQGIGRLELPRWHGRPMRIDLGAPRPNVQEVQQRAPGKNVRGRWCQLESRRDRLDGREAFVGSAEGRQIERGRRPEQDAIARLGLDELFRTVPRVGPEAVHDGQIGPRDHGEIRADVAIREGWRPARARDGRPDALVRRDFPHQPRRGQQAPAPERIVFELRPQRQRQPSADLDFVLHERVEGLGRPGGQLDGQRIGGRDIDVTIPGAEHQAVSRAETHAVLSVDIARAFGKLHDPLVPVRVRVVALDLNHVAVIPGSRPAAEDRAFARVRDAIGGRCPAHFQTRQLQPSGPRLIRREMSLRQHGVRSTRSVDAEPVGEGMPPVVEHLGARAQGVVVSGPLGEHAIRGAACRSAVTHARASALKGPRARIHGHALRFSRRTRDHVDHAVDGVGAPDRATRSTNDLDAVDIRNHQILQVPEHA